MSDVAVASDWDIINYVLTASPVEVTYTRPIRGFKVKARGETDILHRRSAGASSYATIKGGTEDPITVILRVASPSLGFFSGTTGETMEAYVFW